MQRPTATLAIASAVLFALVAAAACLGLQRAFAERRWQAMEAQLRSEAALIADGLGQEVGRATRLELQPRVQELGRLARVRITLIESDGTVLADSDGRPEIMDNLRTRPEVLASLEQDFALCRRFSPTLGVESLFCARALQSGGETAGWIRVSVTTASVPASLDLRCWTLLAALVLAAFGALASLAVLARRRASRALRTSEARAA